ncbi:MAG: response regulator transcription factor [bacterium]|nr:response regulator transcription factor [bacterium]
MLRVLIADDHAVVRQGLMQILGEMTEAVEADQVASGPEALAKVWEKDYDVALLDVSMPGMTGLEVLKELRTDKPQLPVLMLSMHSEEQYAVRALKAGASGYLTKASTPEELITAILRIAKGQKYVTATLAEKLADYMGSVTDQAPHECLSDREYEVMCKLASGTTVTEIAKELSLSVKTVSTYRTRILNKMNLKTNAQLTFYAIENHLID